jgi:phosphoglucosamine mutase
MAAAIVLGEEKHGRAKFTIGKDTRISSDMLEAALMAGLCAAGADVLHLGVIPTPAVAYLTKKNGADAGVVISASHNPYEHNGIKIFNDQGFKLFDTLEEKIEALVLSEKPLPVKRTGTSAGSSLATSSRAVSMSSTARDGAGGRDSCLKIAVDCANGAAAATAPRLFAGLRCRLICSIFHRTA